MDPIINCAIGACCPMEVRVKALTEYLQREGMDEAASKQAAELILKAFDLAPAGTLLPLIQSVAGFAKGTPFKS